MTRQPLSPPAFPALVLLAGSLLWGISWWPLKHFGAEGISGNLMVVASYGMVALFSLPVLWSQRRQWQRQAGLVALMALFGGWANTSFVNALMHGNVIRVMLLFYMAPVWGVLAGKFFLKEHISPRRGLAVALALAGAFILLGGTAAFTAPLALVDLLALSAGLTFALNNVATRAAHDVPMASKTFIVFFGCAVVAGGAALMQGQPFPALDGGTWGLILLFALTWLVLATLATQYGVTHMEAGRASVLLIFELVAAVASAVIIGHEAVVPREWVGGALIASAALLEARSA